MNVNLIEIVVRFIYSFMRDISQQLRTWSKITRDLVKEITTHTSFFFLSSYIERFRVNQDDFGDLLLNNSIEIQGIISKNSSVF